MENNTSLMHLKDFLMIDAAGNFRVCLPPWESVGHKIQCQTANFSVEKHRNDYTPLITFRSAIDRGCEIALMPHKYDDGILVMSISKNGFCDSYRSDDTSLWLALLRSHLQIEL